MRRASIFDFLTKFLSILHYLVKDLMQNYNYNFIIPKAGIVLFNSDVNDPSIDRGDRILNLGGDFVTL